MGEGPLHGVQAKTSDSQEGGHSGSVVLGESVGADREDVGPGDCSVCILLESGQ